MNKMLNILNRLDVCQVVISELLGINVVATISPGGDDNFFLGLLIDDGSDYSGDYLITLLIHINHDYINDSIDNLDFMGTYHITQRHELNYDYNKIASALSAAIGIYEKYSK